MMAQDPHYSQFYSAPLMLNPGMTGMFNGSYRVVANYRNQWSSISADAPFRTFAGSFDFRFDVGRSSKDAIGFGAAVYNDKAGDSDFSTTRTGLSLAYLKALNDLANHYVSIGFQGMFEQRNLNYSNLYFDNQYEAGTGFNPLLNDGESFELDSYSNFDLNAGIIWYYVPSDKFQIFLGVTVHHLVQPNQSFKTLLTEGLYLKYSASGGIGVKVSEKTEIISSMLFMRQGPHTEYNAGVGLKYFSNPRIKSASAVSAGVWTRFGGSYDGGIGTDAVVAVATYYLKSVQVGLSYDINTSTLGRATGGRGAFEVSLIHIGNFSKKPKYKTIDCPKF